MAKVYQEIASKIQAMRNCFNHDNVEWFTRHSDAIDNIVRYYLPSGSGFDAGTQFDACAHVDDNRERLEFQTAFHHMHESGMYRGWTEHKVIVTPSFAGFDLKVTGRDRNGIKDFIAECFHYALEQDV